MQVLRYLKGTADVGLLYKKGVSTDIWDMSMPATPAALTTIRVELLTFSCQVVDPCHGRASEWGMGLSAPVRLSIWG